MHTDIVRSVVEHAGYDRIAEYEQSGLHDCPDRIDACGSADHVLTFLAWNAKRAERDFVSAVVGDQPAPDERPLDGPRDHRLKPAPERDFPCCDQRADDDTSGWEQFDYSKQPDHPDRISVQRVVFADLGLVELHEAPRVADHGIKQGFRYIRFA